MSTRGNLDGRVAVVTGAAQGIGRASAIRLARDGASVVIGDINVSGGEAVADEIQSVGGAAVAQAADVTDEQQVIELVARAVDAFGRLDIIHNNAARLSPDWLNNDGDITKMTAALWDETLEINLRGVMFGCKHAIPRMLESGSGSIINMASIHGVLARGAIPAYGVSKAAVAHLTKCIAVQFGKQGIRCNAIAPGTILTPVNASLAKDVLDANEAVHLTPRLGRPEDIANAVAFLASDEESGFVTGHILVVDGGRTVPFLGGFDDIHAGGPVVTSRADTGASGS